MLVSVPRRCWNVRLRDTLERPAIDVGQGRTSADAGGQLGLRKTAAQVAELDLHEMLDAIGVDVGNKLVRGAGGEFLQIAGGNDGCPGGRDAGTGASVYIELVGISRVGEYTLLAGRGERLEIGEGATVELDCDVEGH